MCHIIHTSNHETILGKAATTFTCFYGETHKKTHKSLVFQFIGSCVQSRNHYGTIMVLNCGPGAVVLHESFSWLTGPGAAKLL